MTKVVVHYGNKLFLPMPVRTVITGVKSIKYIYQGIHTLLQRRIEVPVLDATATGVSMFRGDISTAGSVMFLLVSVKFLKSGPIKKSVDDLARSCH